VDYDGKRPPPTGVFFCANETSPHRPGNGFRLRRHPRFAAFSLAVFPSAPFVLAAVPNAFREKQNAKNKTRAKRPGRMIP
jgi:hypothetical protein